ncbi:unnamed protein product [Mytilus edulis]|uniref:Uncharacterized protein n=1 Tax=Mytilus edulis TaxID=6550 RepID=A0A8S3T607_MYTED|nr:unnamed protein product [Mytilus edulis]
MTHKNSVFLLIWGCFLILGPTLQTSTSKATENTTSVDSITEFSNITLPMITGSLTPTSDISATATSYLNTGTTNLYAKTESTNFFSSTETIHLYTKSESTTSYANTETSNLNANIATSNSHANTDSIYVDVTTETTEIQTENLRIVSNTMSNYQSVFVSKAAKTGSFDAVSQIMTETFAFLAILYHHLMK